MKPYYSRGGIDIYVGDAREVLPTLPNVDVVLTDPPYGNDTVYDGYEDTQEALESLICTTMPLLREKATRVLLTPGVGNLWRYPQPDWTLAWFTPAGAGSGPWGFCCWQPIIAYGKDPYLQESLGRRPDAIVWTETSEKNGHPVPKPIAFWRWLVQRAVVRSTDVICDPFCGSGTTLRAAKDLGFKAISIEQSERYAEIAANRLQQEVFAL